MNWLWNDLHSGGNAPSKSTSQPYYFEKVGTYRWDNVTSTDLGINYEAPISDVKLFIQAEILNLFDEQAVVSGFVGVRTLSTFDPLNEIPVDIRISASRDRQVPIRRRAPIASR